MRATALAAVLTALLIGGMLGILALISCGGRNPVIAPQETAVASYPDWPATCSLAVSDVVFSVGAVLPSPLPAIVVEPGGTVQLHAYKVCDGAVEAVLQ